MCPVIIQTEPSQEAFEIFGGGRWKRVSWQSLFIEISYRIFFFPCNLVCDVKPAVLNYEPKALGWGQSIRIPGVVCNVPALVSVSRLPLNAVPQQVK